MKVNKYSKKLLIFTFSFILLFLFGCQFNDNFFLFSRRSAPEKNKKINNENGSIINNETAAKVSRFLDGLEVEKGQENHLPVAMVFDNFPGAPRPTLASASIIYEMPVEGGLTRFLAIFDQANLPELAGPIRSARPYSAEVAEEYKALYIHAGGSPDALFKIKQGFYNLTNLDEISGQGKYFGRDHSLPAPHNLYIKKEGINKFIEDAGISLLASFSGWYYNQEIRAGDQESEEIKITFSPLIENYWRYETNQKKYQYLPDNKNYRDKNNQEILVDNLIIQYTPIKVLDEVGRREINLTGQGKALIFQRGNVINGQWRKEAGRTKFYTQAGDEIFFIPGKTWVSLISPTSQVSY